MLDEECARGPGRLRVAVLVSGNGTNLQALIDAFPKDDPRVDLVVVVSNQAEAFALERARRAGIGSRVIHHRDFASRAEFEDALALVLRERGAQLVVLAGFMRLLGATLLDAFAQRVINVHPALCPAFPGLDAPRQALEHGARLSGCTVHFVDGGTDTGPIIAQSVVPIAPDDDATSLGDRIRRAEHALLPLVVSWFSEGRVRVTGRRVSVLPAHTTR